MEPFKRRDDPEAPYYVKFQVKGKQYLWSTKTNDIAKARTRARHYRNQVVAGAFHMVEAMKARSTTPTFATLIEEYLVMPFPDPITRTSNVACMRFVMAESGLKDADKIDRLTKDVGVKWLRAGGRSDVTKNSVLRKAKSLFSKRALFCYKCEIPLPVIQGFLNTPCLSEAERLPEIPSDSVMAACQAGIAKPSDMYNAFLLAAYAGLRAGEMVAAKWDWIVGDTLYVGGRPDFDAKSRRWRTVRLSPDVRAALHANGSMFICGNSAKNLVERALPSVLRGYGVVSRNPTHSLRRWYGSQVADKHGLWAAKNLLGHSTYAVTEQSYARQINLPAGLSLSGTAPSSPPPPPPAEECSAAASCLPSDRPYSQQLQPAF